MKKFICTLLICLSIGIGFSQTVITRESAGETFIHDGLLDAVEAAVDGDVLYLSGGVFSSNSIITLDKSITMYGVGFRQDSTLATNPSIVNSEFRLLPGSENSVIEGCMFQGNMTMEGAINNVLFSRTMFYGLVDLSVSTTIDAPAYNIVFDQCVFSSTFMLDGANDIIVRNCIMYGELFCENVSCEGNALFDHNVFVWNTTGEDLTHIYNSIFTNNIFACNGQCQSFSEVTGNTNFFNRNIFTYDYSTAPLVGSNNFHDINLNDVFGQEVPVIYSLSFEYRPEIGSIAEGNATDGTDIGIYGGNIPWKEGSIPHHPYINNGSYIGSLTNPDGTLPVYIKVTAQDY